MAKPSNALAGRKFNWTFSDGPTAGKTYEHTFANDGTVVFKEAGGSAQQGGSSSQMPGSKYAAFEIAPNIYLVSYLSSHGYTLTVAMNLASKQLNGFASNDKEWHPLEGTVEEVK
ncbi:MAG TPA: MoaF N-terminal domain-containing protein [Gemmatimonadaceae bacterium]|jgi:hypothetical protein|nr:MoaF N-terminal domain-containing protein [Gemmatimonadaceae bacterium]